MSNEKAFVFDTNFIIQNHNLNEVVDNLINKGFVVYITQVAIDERIAQECLKQKTKYDKIESFQREIQDFATIKIIKPYEDTRKMYHDGMQKKYEALFGKNIIPINKSASAFERVLQRAYMKIPPFITSGTDKGFKDSLMWLSVIDFFKSNGENEIIFVSNDNGFRENVDFLCAEFEENTGKKIEIKDNSYYKSILDSDVVKKDSEKTEFIPDVSQIREKIRNVITNLCGCEVEDNWGEYEWVRSFTLSQKVDEDYMEVVLNGLKNDITKHIFDEYVSATDIFALDDRVKDGNVSISISELEDAYKLVEEIKKKYPEYLKQFYATAANIFNNNYEAPPISFEDIDDSDLPF